MKAPSQMLEYITIGLKTNPGSCLITSWCWFLSQRGNSLWRSLFAPAIFAEWESSSTASAELLRTMRKWSLANEETFLMIFHRLSWLSGEKGQALLIHGSEWCASHPIPDGLGDPWCSERKWIQLGTSLETSKIEWDVFAISRGVRELKSGTQG